MKALLIDPETQTVKPILTGDPEQSFDQLYEIIGTNIVETIHMPPQVNACFFIDEEGLLKSDQSYFSLRITTQPLYAGKCVVFGLTGYGHCASVPFTAEQLETIVNWEPAPNPEVLADMLVPQLVPLS